jgi:type I restriction-modification system DNA methylase subunit
VLFINAESLYKRGRNQNSLEAEHAKQIFRLYEGSVSESGLSYIASISEIEEKNYNLNIPLYVSQVRVTEELSFADSLQNLSLAHDKTKESRELISQDLKQWGLDDAK